MSNRFAIQMSVYSLVLTIFSFQIPLAYALTGKEVYMQNCVACHGVSGKGTIPGAPDLTDSNGVLTKSDKDLLQYIETNRAYPGTTRTMPAKGGNPNLTHEEIKQSLKYIRQSFGKKTSSRINSTTDNNKKPNHSVEISIKKKLADRPNGELTQKISARDFSTNAAHGARAWATTCSGCHNIHSPSKYSQAQWRTVMLHMRKQANLTAQQSRDILAFLESSSQ